MNFSLNQRVRVVVSGRGPKPRALNGDWPIPAGVEGTIVSEGFTRRIPYTMDFDLMYLVRIEGYNNPPCGYAIEAYNLRPLSGPSATDFYEALIKRIKDRQPVEA